MSTKYSQSELQDIEIGVPLAWTGSDKKSKAKQSLYKNLELFLKGDSDPVAVIVSGCPSVTVSAPDALVMKKKKPIFDSSELGEIFLSKGYRVLFIHQHHDPTPFAASLTNSVNGDDNIMGRLSTSGREVRVNLGSMQSKVASAINAYKEGIERNFLLNVVCDRLEEYMYAIRTASQFMRSAGDNVIWVFAWDLPSHHFPPKLSARPSPRRDSGEGDSVSSQSFSSVNDFPLPFTDSRVEELPVLLLSFREECAVSGLLVSVACRQNEAQALDASRDLIAMQDVDLALGVSLEKNKRVYFLMDSRDSSSVLRLAVSSRKPKIVVENALVAALVAKQQQIFGSSLLPPVTDTVVARLAQRHIDGDYPSLEDTFPGAVGRRGDRQEPPEVVRAGTLLRTMTTMAGNDELIGHRACGLFCVISVVFVVGFFALVTYLMRDV